MWTVPLTWRDAKLHGWPWLAAVWDGAEPHTHRHAHEPLAHSHPYVPDLHHRHRH